MARPQKAGLVYFSLDVDMDQDDKVVLIEAKHGIAGFTVLMKLLMKVYKEGYFYKWTEREQLLFSNRVNVDINTINEIVNDCIKWEMFDPTLYEEYDILTSSGIQKRYFEAITRRTEITLIAEYLVIPPIKSSKNLTVNVVSVYKNNACAVVNVDINPTQDELKDTPVHKVKETKQNIVKDSKLSYAANVKMKEDEYLKLCEEFGVDTINGKIEDLNNWKGGKGKTTKDDYLTIRAWIRKDVKASQNMYKPLKGRLGVTEGEGAGIRKEGM